LRAVHERIVLSSRALMQRLETDRSTGSLGAEISALVGYEKRIQSARTWGPTIRPCSGRFSSPSSSLGGAAIAGFLSGVLF
jgi:hypothetical protein